MARKRTIQSIEKDLTAIRKRIETTTAELNKLKTSEENLLQELKTEQDRIRAENFDEIGKYVYKVFGENISPDEFKDRIEAILTIDEAKEFIESEKDNSLMTAEISPQTEIEREAC